MTESELTCAEATAYQHIFKNTYWGGGKYDDDCKKIIENRNKLVKDYELVRRTKKRPKYINDLVYKNAPDYRVAAFWDHVEVYESHESYVIISSPYGPPSNYHVPDTFQHIYPVYSASAESYVGIVSKRTRKAKRAVLQPVSKSPQPQTMDIDGQVSTILLFVMAEKPCLSSVYSIPAAAHFPGVVQALGYLHKHGTLAKNDDVINNALNSDDVRRVYIRLGILGPTDDKEYNMWEKYRTAADQWECFIQENSGDTIYTVAIANFE